MSTFLAKNYCISRGVGESNEGLPSFDKALLEAGVGNYNLVRLSSILPASCVRLPVEELPNNLKEGSLLPTAYSTISSDVEGDVIVSTIGVGLPADINNVGVIMEYSTKNVTEEEALKTLESMIREAFDVRGWKLDNIVSTSISAKVGKSKCTTFACIAEW
jgi:arginine decarboxylase